MKAKTRYYLAGIVCAMLASTVFGQFYFPDNVDYGTPGKYGLKYESISFVSRDGTKLHGWFVPATSSAFGTVIHFHGNAQNMSAHFSYVSWLPQYGFNVFTFDYRGYGTSAGAPTAFSKTCGEVNETGMRPLVARESASCRASGAGAKT